MVTHIYLLILWYISQMSFSINVFIIIYIIETFKNLHCNLLAVISTVLKHRYSQNFFFCIRWGRFRTSARFLLLFAALMGDLPSLPVLWPLSLTQKVIERVNLKMQTHIPVTTVYEGNLLWFGQFFFHFGLLLWV